MAVKEHHVSPSASGGWKIQKSGSTRASAHTVSKVEAVRIGKVISQRSGSTLKIHESEEKLQGK
ncbi:MAG: DUF2188 domain-containing protein [Clostridiales bacterium]|jgi:hypothetical protein|nr:DUF2188 domain-containing protein [Clostridiales bacterium]